MLLAKRGLIKNNCEFICKTKNFFLWKCSPKKRQFCYWLLARSHNAIYRAINRGLPVVATWRVSPHIKSNNVSDRFPNFISSKIKMITGLQWKRISIISGPALRWLKYKLKPRVGQAYISKLYFNFSGEIMAMVQIICSFD